MANCKGNTCPPEEYTPDEVMRLIWACGNRRPSNKRYRAMIVVMWAGMARCNEMMAMRPFDYDRKTGKLYIYKGKGRKGVASTTRWVSIAPPLRIFLERWLDVRKKYLKTQDRPPPDRRLFCTSNATPLDYKTHVWRMLVRMGAKAEITKHIRAHNLRRSGAMLLMRQGYNIGVISRALGHRNISTTNIYLQQTTQSEVMDALNNTEWVPERHASRLTIKNT